MRNVLKIVFGVMAICLLFAGPARAQYTESIMTPAMKVQYIRGELRFCEVEMVKGVVCGYEQNLLGKKKFAARDWWSPETYIQAMTGLNEFTIYDVRQYPDGRLELVFSL